MITITPRLALIIPTYNEKSFIKQKLDDALNQKYHELEIIVVDSASTDRTPALVNEWMADYPNISLKLIREPSRKGKTKALWKAFENVTGDLVILTDADSFFESTAFNHVVRYFADPTIGAVTSSMIYTTGKETDRNSYRAYFNLVRVAESKKFSTPIHNGPFLAIKCSLIEKLGLPDFPASDDSSFGSFIAFSGLRAIQVDDIFTKEPILRNQNLRMIRRAQHLLVNFHFTKKYAKKEQIYKRFSFRPYLENRGTFCMC